MSRMLALLLSIMVLLLAACGTRPATPADTQPAPPAASEQQPAEPPIEIIVSAAASLTEPFKPADLFVSAAKGPMDALVKQGLVAETAVKPLVSNKVVLIRSKATGEMVKSWEDLKREQVKRVAIGNPEHTPIGQYAQSVFEKLGLTAALKNRLVLGEVGVRHWPGPRPGQAGAGGPCSTSSSTCRWRCPRRSWASTCCS